MIKKVKPPRVYIASVGIDVGGTYFVIFKTRYKPELIVTGRGATFEEAHKNAAKLYENAAKLYEELYGKIKSSVGRCK